VFKTRKENEKILVIRGSGGIGNEIALEQLETKEFITLAEAPLIFHILT